MIIDASGFLTVIGIITILVLAIVGLITILAFINDSWEKHK